MEKEIKIHTEADFIYVHNVISTLLCSLVKSTSLLELNSRETKCNDDVMSCDDDDVLRDKSWIVSTGSH